MFLAKAVTIVIAIVIIISAISPSGGRQKKPGKKGSLKVSRLNDHLEEMRDTLRFSVLDKDDLKALQKEEKKTSKAELKEQKESVKKAKDVSWNDLKPMIISHLNDYFEKNSEPILKSVKNIENNRNKNETVSKIIEVLDTKIRPAVARDGGDIKFKSFKNGVVRVELQGSCSGCPSSLMTLKQGVQNLLKHYVKEVNSVEAI